MIMIRIVIVILIVIVIMIMVTTEKKASMIMNTESPSMVVSQAVDSAGMINTNQDEEVSQQVYTCHQDKEASRQIYTYH